MALIASSRFIASSRSSRHGAHRAIAFHRVIALIASSRFIAPSTDQFWGDRAAWIVDPAGHVWTVAARIEETTEEERQARLSRIHKESTISESRADLVKSG